MFGKIEFVTEGSDCVYVCVCPVCRTLHYVNPVSSSAEDGVYITTETKINENAARHQEGTTVNTSIVNLNITCKKCGAAFKNSMATTVVCECMSGGNKHE